MSEYLEVLKFISDNFKEFTGFFSFKDSIGFEPKKLIINKLGDSKINLDKFRNRIELLYPLEDDWKEQIKKAITKEIENPSY